MSQTRPRANKLRKSPGFTIIELLVVLSIISLLASITLVATINGRKKARDSIRRETLHRLSGALELYYNDNNSYPTTTVGYSRSSLNPTDYIPGLVPKYLAKLPADPKQGLSILNWTGCVGQPAEYYYASDGRDYKLFSFCAAEMGYSPDDPLNDPARDGGPLYWTGGTNFATPETDPASPFNPRSCDDPPATSNTTGLTEYDLGLGDGTIFRSWAVFSSLRTRCL